MKLPILFLFLFSLSVHAADDEEKPSPEGGRRGWLLQKNIEISREIDKLARQLDHFLTGKKIVNQQNTSRVTIKSFAGHAEGGDLDTSTNFDVALRLPNLEKHWQLKFTDYEEEENRGLQNTQLRRTARNKNYGTSVALYRQLGKFSTTFQPRLELRDPLELSYLLRFETKYEDRIFWLKPRMELFADPNKGTGEFFSIEMSWLLNEDYSINFTNEEEYRDFENFFFTNHSLALGQKIKDNAGMSYSVAVNCSNRATYHLNSYSFASIWGHQIYRNVLHYSTGPYWEFAHSKSFKGRVGYTVSLELIF